MEYFVSQDPTLILFTSIWIYDFGPEKLSGHWRNGPWARLHKTSVTTTGTRTCTRNLSQLHEIT